MIRGASDNEGLALTYIHAYRRNREEGKKYGRGIGKEESHIDEWMNEWMYERKREEE